MGDSEGNSNTGSPEAVLRKLPKRRPKGDMNCTRVKGKSVWGTVSFN